ncbi:MAG: mRNA surveillance protein pelota [Candidatus Nanoarchaeia archaeon]
MRQNSVNKKHGEAVLTVESMEDLWYLQQIIEPGDVVKGRTTRKVKIEGGSERTAAVVKKHVHLEITVEKTELTDTQLRVSGQVLHGTEDVRSGSYHTFAIDPGIQFTLRKTQWLSFHWEKLDEACMPTHAPIVILVHDRETGIFALLKKTGVEILNTMKGQVAKKRMEQQSSNFFNELAKQLHAYDDRFSPESVILASPSFFKEYVQHELGDMHGKLILATVSSVGDSGIKELLRRDEVKAAVAHDRYTQEAKHVDRLCEEIGKDGKASYGFKACKEAADSGAVEQLFVTDKLLKKMHEEGTYEELDALFKTVDNADGRIVIISSSHEGGQKLDGLGGIGALLRFKVS